MCRYFFFFIGIELIECMDLFTSRTLQRKETLRQPVSFYIRPSVRPLDRKNEFLPILVGIPLWIGKLHSAKVVYTERTGEEDVLHFSILSCGVHSNDTFFLVKGHSSKEGLSLGSGFSFPTYPKPTRSCFLQDSTLKCSLDFLQYFISTRQGVDNTPFPTLIGGKFWISRYWTNNLGFLQLLSLQQDDYSVIQQPGRLSLDLIRYIFFLIYLKDVSFYFDYMSTLHENYIGQAKSLQNEYLTRLLDMFNNTFINFFNN